MWRKGFKVVLGFWECITGAGPHWRLGARRIRGSPELASEWGKRSPDVSCASVPAPAQTSLARRARTEGEGALEASGCELTSKVQMLGPPARQIHRAVQVPTPHLTSCFMQSVSCTPKEGG